MTLDIFNFVSLAIGVASFVFCLLERREARVLRSKLDSIYETTQDTLANVHRHESRGLQGPEQALAAATQGLADIGNAALEGLRRDAPTRSRLPNTVTAREILAYERSNSVKRVWLLTSDLKPDINDGNTAKVVVHNLMTPKNKYTYFVPTGLPSGELDRLIANLRKAGATDPCLTRIEICRVTENFSDFLGRHQNFALYFADSDGVLPDRAYHEVLTESDQGSCWAVLSPSDVERLWKRLKDVYQNGCVEPLLRPKP